ncbi:hypothetical protein GY45DRAFT_549040 [Cubamyces sp. BRFM 1775]|nr:hypothetical protein GY45DRAFT_549040 [Cubamyces sp. BRFM 1775]
MAITYRWQKANTKLCSGSPQVVAIRLRLSDAGDGSPPPSSRATANEGRRKRDSACGKTVTLRTRSVHLGLLIVNPDHCTCSPVRRGCVGVYSLSALSETRCALNRELKKTIDSWYTLVVVHFGAVKRPQKPFRDQGLFDEGCIVVLTCQADGDVRIASSTELRG